MDTNQIVKGFSKLNRDERIELLAKRSKICSADVLHDFVHPNASYQKLFSEFSENYLSNYLLPLGIVPNVLINDELYMVPVVIEESSVVAAASRAAGFWAQNGGFKTEILGVLKKGQVHFTWTGTSLALHDHFEKLKPLFLEGTAALTEEMKKRGGGIREIELEDLTSDLENYYQIDVTFGTADAMGANFINSCLERISDIAQEYFSTVENDGDFEVIMSILSNHTPESLIRCTVECPVEKLAAMSGSFTPEDFARRFELAVKMARVNVSRAVTHNKGIYNGVDGVVLATGNDWRAVEAAGHAFACQHGKYRALSDIEIDSNVFRYSITLPLAVGTVGGLTRSHPLAKFVLETLGQPKATELMQIMAALGMANNFSAVSSLVTSGIQKGHMKMHLNNILNQLNATPDQVKKAKVHFAKHTVSYSAVANFINAIS